MLDDEQLRRVMKSVSDPQGPPAPPVEGRRIGKYTLTGRLASNTWVALQDGRARPQVLRILGPEPEAGEFRALCDELRALVPLKHPVLLPWHKLSTFEGVHFLVRDFVDGRPLSGGAPGRGREVQVFYEIARALEQAHGLGLVHGALGGTNVILDPGGRPFVVDFGIARLKSRFRRGGAAVRKAEAPVLDVAAMGELFWRALAGTGIPDPRGGIPRLRSVAPEADAAVEAAARRFLISSPRPYMEAGEVAADLGQILSALPSGSGEGGLLDQVRRARVPEGPAGGS